LSENLEKLRNILHESDIDCFIIPHQDEFGSEDVGEWAQRLAFITGFKGSAGYAFIFREKAFLFVDGRYTVAAKNQVNTEEYTIVDLTAANMREVLLENLSVRGRVGYDIHLHSLKGVSFLRKICEQAGASLTPLDGNPIDSIWEDRPRPPNTQVFLHNVKYAGHTHTEKIAAVCEKLKQNHQGAVVLNSPADVCWLLNVRASDAPYTPLALCFAIVHVSGSVDWFIDSDRVPSDVQAYLGSNVRIFPPAVFYAELGRLARKGISIRLDSDSVTAGIENAIAMDGGKAVLAENMFMTAKAAKNIVEAEGMRNAHKKDGAALCSFLAWLSENGGSQDLNEYQAAEKVDEFRSEQELFFAPSFQTISAFGANSAVVHYAPEKTGSAKIVKNGVYLLDSGGQYLDGTTDVTRTVAIGEVSEEAKEKFTLVLKGHIALASAVFPKGTKGNALDVLARQFLWQRGCDYAHGTGHGVGCFSCVHEVPPTISPSADAVPLCENMVVSDEPGYYEERKFGIRCESLLMVQKCGKYPDMLAFEVLTLAPFDANMIKKDMLTEQEINWLNDYHTKVLKEIAPLVDEKTAKWLKKATLPL
jgi:Xaa-Pro aminopeptidase